MDPSSINLSYTPYCNLFSLSSGTFQPGNLNYIDTCFHSGMGTTYFISSPGQAMQVFPSAQNSGNHNHVDGTSRRNMTGVNEASQKQEFPKPITRLTRENDCLVMEIELPGVLREHVHVFLTNNTVEVTGIRLNRRAGRTVPVRGTSGSQKVQSDCSNPQGVDGQNTPVQNIGPSDQNSNTRRRSYDSNQLSMPYKVSFELPDGIDPSGIETISFENGILYLRLAYLPGLVRRRIAV